MNINLNKQNLIKYAPSKSILPGETLAEVLQSLNMSQTELAERMSRPIKVINEIIQGKASITPETSIQLERVFNIPARVWNNLESNYQEFLAREKIELELQSEIKYAEQYPYIELAKWGWVSEEKEKIKRVINLQSFFGVTSLKNVIEMQAIQAVSYRISTKRTHSIPAIAAWLRKGIIDSQSIETQNFDESKFKDAIKEVREMVNKNLDIFKEKAPKLLAESGVALVVTPNLKNAPINGASRWIAPNKALIQLSIRNKYSDIFWFTLFHECAHVLKHGKKDINIDLAKNGMVETSKEEEADQYSKETLIASPLYEAFVKHGDFSTSSIRSFASLANVLPGNVIGRLQHDGRIPMNTALNHERVKYEWQIV